MVTVEVEVEHSDEESLGTGWIFDRRGTSSPTSTSSRVTPRSGSPIAPTTPSSPSSSRPTRPRNRAAPARRPELPGSPLPVRRHGHRKGAAERVTLASEHRDGQVGHDHRDARRAARQRAIGAERRRQQGQSTPQVYDDMLQFRERASTRATVAVRSSMRPVKSSASSPSPVRTPRRRSRNPDESSGHAADSLVAIRMIQSRIGYRE